MTEFYNRRYPFHKFKRYDKSKELIPVTHNPNPAEIYGQIVLLFGVAAMVVTIVRRFTN